MSNIWRKLDKYITKFDSISDHRAVNIYPSEASATIKNKHGEDEVLGGCTRKSFLRYKFAEESNKHPGEPILTILVNNNTSTMTFNNGTKEPRLEWIFEEGRRIEAGLIQIAKEAGIYYSGHKKFFHKIEEGFFLSGEIDAIFNLDGELVIVEIKSVSGYISEKDIFGSASDRSRGIKGYPRYHHLLQTALYAWKYRDQISKAKILYFMRGSCLREEFEITVEEVPENQDFKILVDGIDSGITINNILNKYKTLVAHIKANTLPDRDFDLIYDDNKMNLLLSRDELPKSKKEAWQKYWDRIINGGRKLKRPDHGDGECGWCSYQELCYDQQGTPIQY